jgi:hypothetical protein
MFTGMNQHNMGQFWTWALHIVFIFIVVPTRSILRGK